MTYRTEFPDFDLDVAIPASFEDVSWHNDAAPCWISAARRLALWVDYADPDKREFPEVSRFVLTKVDADGQHADGVVLETDDYSEVLRHLGNDKGVGHDGER